MSENPLVKKLKIQSGQRLLIMNAPEGYLDQFDRLPSETVVSKKPEGIFDFVQLFATSKAELDKLAPQAISALKPDGMFWISYPKKSSKIQSDLTMYNGWEVLTKAGYYGIALISIDDTWSAARFRPKAAVKRRPGGQSELAKFIDMKKRVVKLPADFQSALKKGKKAWEFFQTLSFTNRKEYVVWIIEAKQPETRKKRIKLSMEKLQNGLKNPSAKSR